MGQYFIIVDLDKKEFLDSYWFGHHNKLPSYGRTAEGAIAGLAILLACSGSGRYSSGPIYGRWAGDRIAFMGDYFRGTVGGHEFDQDIWCAVRRQEDGWVGIGEQVRHTLETDWKLTLLLPMVDGTDPRSVLHPDGTITAVPGPVWDEASSRWLPPPDQTGES